MLKSATARPFLSLRLLLEPATLGGCAGEPAVWAALCDLEGTATISRDWPGGGPAWCCTWRPYGGTPGLASVWWGCPGGGSGGGLGSRYCFTTGGDRLLTAWLLPAAHGTQQQQQQQQPRQLAEVRLPFPGHTLSLAAALLPTQPHVPHLVALVAVGNTDGSVTVLLLTLPAAGTEEQGAGSSTAQLAVLAAARRVHATTPVRAVSLQMPAAPLEPAGDQAQHLSAVLVVSAGGDSTVSTLRLPPAAVAAAAAELQAGGGQASARQGAELEPPPPPHCLMCTRRRQYDQVTHMDGVLPGGPPGGQLVFGFRASQLVVWDDGSEAAVAEVSWLRHAAVCACTCPAAAQCALCPGRLV